MWLLYEAKCGQGYIFECKIPNPFPQDIFHSIITAREHGRDEDDKLSFNTGLPVFLGSKGEFFIVKTMK